MVVFIVSVQCSAETRIEYVGPLAADMRAAPDGEVASPVRAFIRLPGTLQANDRFGDNSSYAGGQATVLEATITDGKRTFDYKKPGDIFSIDLRTDSSGQITAWRISAGRGTDPNQITILSPGKTVVNYGGAVTGQAACPSLDVLQDRTKRELFCGLPEWKINGKSSLTPKQCVRKLPHRPSQQTAEYSAEYTPPNVCVDKQVKLLFIGGFFDEWDSHTVRDYAKNFPFAPNMDVAYANWQGILQNGMSIATWMAALPEDAEIKVVGHSYGGDTAVNLAEKCQRRIALMITVDPVGGLIAKTPFPKVYSPRDPPRQYPQSWAPRISSKMELARKCVGKWINVNAEPGDGHWDNSDFIADFGGKYGRLPNLPIKYVNFFVSADRLHHKDFGEMLELEVIPDDKSAVRKIKQYLYED